MTRTEVQNRLTEVIRQNKDGIVKGSVRVGKTKTALDAIEEDDVVYWFYPRNPMMKGYQDDIEKFQPKSKNITFVNYASVKKLAVKECTFLILDEPQDMSLGQIQAVKEIKFKKRVALSGTLSGKTLKRLEDELNLRVIVEYGLEDAIRDELVKNYSIEIHMTSLDNKVKKEFKRFGKPAWGTEKEIYDYYSQTIAHFQSRAASCAIIGDKAGAFRNSLGEKKYMGLRTNLLYESPSLMQLSSQIIEQYKDKKALIYTLRTEVADSLTTITYHSKNKEDAVLEWFEKSTEGHMGAVNCITTGINTENVEVVIFHSYTSNTETFVQKLARSLLLSDESRFSKVIVSCIKDTQNERWIDDACAGLDPEKIVYIDTDGKRYKKYDWFKHKYPGRELYIVEKTNQLLFYMGLDEIGKHCFAFPNNLNKTYNYNLRSIKKI